MMYKIKPRNILNLNWTIIYETRVTVEGIIKSLQK